MSSRERYEDVATVLFLVPFIASGVYGLYLWTLAGLSPLLPSTVYLAVTREPSIFVGGSLAVFLGIVIELAGSGPEDRRAKVESQSGFLQKVAAASFVLALAMAWYANGFVDISGTATDFIVGRFSIVFPVFLLLLSYLVTAPFKLGALTGGRILGIVFMLLVPVVVYEVGKREAAVGLGVSALLLVAGLYLFLRSGKRTEAKTST